LVSIVLCWFNFDLLADARKALTRSFRRYAEENAATQLEANETNLAAHANAAVVMEAATNATIYLYNAMEIFAKGLIEHLRKNNNLTAEHIMSNVNTNLNLKTLLATKLFNNLQYRYSFHDDF
jgi:hypothetical protein